MNRVRVIVFLLLHRSWALELPIREGFDMLLTVLGPPSIHGQKNTGPYRSPKQNSTKKKKLRQHALPAKAKSVVRW